MGNDGGGELVWGLIVIAFWLAVAASIVAAVVAAFSILAGIGGAIGLGCSAKNFALAIRGNLGQRSFAS